MKSQTILAIAILALLAFGCATDRRVTFSGQVYDLEYSRAYVHVGVASIKYEASACGRIWSTEEIVAVPIDQGEKLSLGDRVVLSCNCRTDNSILYGSCEIVELEE